MVRHGGSWEAERRGLGQGHVPKDPTPTVSPTPTPNNPFTYEAINGLIHWWSQNPHDPITSEFCIGDQVFNTWVFGGTSYLNRDWRTVLPACSSFKWRSTHQEGASLAFQKGTSTPISNGLWAASIDGPGAGSPNLTQRHCLWANSGQSPCAQKQQPLTSPPSPATISRTLSAQKQGNSA
jgi:hypothetical protein